MAPNKWNSKPYICGMKKSLNLVYDVLPDMASLGPDQLHCLEKAIEGLSRSYAPYSEFRVSAAVELHDGTIVLGSNQENMAYPSGLCAERVAFFNAASTFPNKKIKRVAITAQTDKKVLDNPISPCGACRQVMLEYELNQEEGIEVILFGNTGQVFVIQEVKDLLPLHFFEAHLKQPGN